MVLIEVAETPVSYWCFLSNDVPPLLYPYVCPSLCDLLSFSNLPGIHIHIIKLLNWLCSTLPLSRGILYGNDMVYRNGDLKSVSPAVGDRNQKWEKHCCTMLEKRRE